MNIVSLKNSKFIHIAQVAVFYVPLGGFTLYERIRTKFSTNYAKQTQFFSVFNLKIMISLKNKPNSKPIQSQTKPIMSQKLGGQSQFKAKQTQFENSINNIMRDFNTTTITPVDRILHIYKSINHNYYSSRKSGYSSLRERTHGKSN